MLEQLCDYNIYWHRLHIDTVLYKISCFSLHPHPQSLLLQLHGINCVIASGAGGTDDRTGFRPILFLLQPRVVGSSKTGSATRSCFHMLHCKWDRSTCCSIASEVGGNASILWCGFRCLKKGHLRNLACENLFKINYTYISHNLL